MPRKRTTKINVRATPKVSRSTEADQLSENERVEKMQVFLQDFDDKVEMQLRTMEDEKKRMLQCVSRRLHVQIMKMTKKVRNMTLLEFIDTGGILDDVAPQQSQVDNLNERLDMKCDTILEEQTPGVAPTPATTTRKNYGTRAKSKRGQDNTSAIKSSFKTPYNGHMTTCWDTPLITPKFDPRLPYVSTNSRAPKPNERLVSMQGSPVAVFNKKGPSIKLTDNKLTMDLNLKDGVSLDDMDIDMCDDHIQRVMSIFSQISKKFAHKQDHKPVGSE